MVDIYGVLKVNDCVTGVLLEKVDDIVHFDDIDSIEELTEEDRTEFLLTLKNMVHPEVFSQNTVSRIEFVELDNEFFEGVK